MDDVTFIILGATGDLAKRKLIPAFYELVKNKKIGKFAVIGVARRDIGAKDVLAMSRKFIPRIEEAAWKSVQDASYYFQMDFNSSKGYFELGNFIQDVEDRHKLKGNRMFYLATMPEHFDVITSNLSKTRIARERKRKWSRIVYEKPFGWDLKSARSINKEINRVFREKQIYRIDHYLGKELVGDIALMRFTNRILEPLWSNAHLDSVQIIMSEDIGLEGRAAYYDKYGALKDVVQNHGMQLLALTAMESPKLIAGEHVRDKKADVLKKVKVKGAMLGQYEGYTKEAGVLKNSKTETFAALHLEINNKRWKGVPFYIKAGKYLDKKSTGIHLKFKMVECLLAQNCPADTNYFTIRIAPDDGFAIELNSKVPGKKTLIVPVKMDFCEKCHFGPNTPEAYETLLEDVINGDQSVFVRNDEIEYSWRVIEGIKRGKVYKYPKGSRGPKEFEEWSAKHNLRWRA